MSEKKSFVLFNDLSIPVQSLSDEEAGKLFKAIFEYQNGGIEQELSGSAEMAFIFVKQQMDRSQEMYDEMCKKNSENAHKRWDKVNATASDRMRSDAKHADSDPDPDSDSENDKEEKRDYTAPDSIIDYFNEKTGKKMKHKDLSRKPIIARLNDKFTVEDCKKVIDIKYDEWIDDENMNKYIRISTLFGSKFEIYLNQEVKNELSEGAKRLMEGLFDD